MINFLTNIFVSKLSTNYIFVDKLPTSVIPMKFV